MLHTKEILLFMTGH